MINLKINYNMNVLIGLVLIGYGGYQLYSSLKNKYEKLIELYNKEHIGINAYIQLFLGGVGSIIMGVFILYKEFFDGGFQWQP